MKMSKLTAVLSAMAILLSAPLTASAERGEKTIGLTGGYNFYNNSGTAGVKFSYDFAAHVRIAPSVEYTFRHRDFDAFTVNLDMQFPWRLTSSTVSVYPLAGINITRWTYNEYSPDNDDISQRFDRLGLNLGGGIGWRATKSLKLTVEGRHSFLKQFHHASVSASIAYIF